MQDQKAFLNEIRDYVDQAVKESFYELKQSLDSLKHLVEQRISESGIHKLFDFKKSWGCSSFSRYPIFLSGLKNIRIKRHFL